MADLARMGQTASGIVARGQVAYLADDPDGETRRLAGRRLVTQVATVVERLPDAFKAGCPDVEWAKIQLMRTLVAHHEHEVLDEFVGESLRTRVPHLLTEVGRSGRGAQGAGSAPP